MNKSAYLFSAKHFGTDQAARKILCSDDRIEDTRHNGPGSHRKFSEQVPHHENQMKLDLYDMPQAAHQAS